jgi:hypothetical protein
MSGLLSSLAMLTLELPLRPHPVISNTEVARRDRCRRAIILVSGSQIEQTFLSERIVCYRGQLTSRLGALLLKFFVQHRHSPVTLAQSEDTRIGGRTQRARPGCG